MERARRDLDQASEAVRLAAAALAHVADQIAADARESERASLADGLASDQIARDVLKLERAFTAAAAGTMSADLEVLRKLPSAILEWAHRRLGLVPYLAVGQELEIPPDRLSAFALEGTLPPGSGLVRVRVLTPGWKRGTRMLVLPRAMLV